MKRVIATTLAALSVLILAWVSGYNFDKRGPTAFAVCFFTGYAALFAWKLSE